MDENNDRAPGARLQMIFARDCEGGLACRLPRDGRGNVRVPDGVSLFSIEQAAAAFGQSQDELRARYWRQFGDVSPRRRPRGVELAERWLALCIEIAGETPATRRDFRRALREMADWSDPWNDDDAPGAGRINNPN